MSLEISPLNSRLQESLRNIPERFLDAILADQGHLANFLVEFSELRKAIEAGKESLALSNETLSLANIVASDVAVLARRFMELKNEASTLCSEFLQKTQSVLKTDTGTPTRPEKPFLQLPRHPSTIPIAHTSVVCLDSEDSSVPGPTPLPEFIEHAYKFFLANIFNPYPTRAEKESIVAQTNSDRVTLSSVCNWFTNARRRCGWTTILRDRCGGSRGDLVALATRLFVNPGPEDPVDPIIARELMEMKEAVETMYERKTRTSAWLKDLANLEDSTQSPSGASTSKEHGAVEDHSQAPMAQKGETFVRRKRKMQEKALRKAEEVAKRVQHERDQQNINDQRVAPRADSQSPQKCSDDNCPTETTRATHNRSKTPASGESDRFHNFQASPALPRSLSFNSDLSFEGRVPSLTYSESGDERFSRSSPGTPAASSYPSSPYLSPALEIPASFDYSITSEPLEGATSDISTFDALFNLPVAPPCESLIARGKKRPHDQVDPDVSASNAKRRRGSQPLVASNGPVLTSPTSSSLTNPLPPSSPLFTPRQSFDATPIQQSRKASLQFPDLETFLGLDLTQPGPVQIAPPDASLPLDVGVFDWASNGFGDMSADVPQSEFSQLLELVCDDVPQATNLSTDLLTFDFNTVEIPSQSQLQTTADDLALPNDMSGLMSSLVSDETLHDIGADFMASLTTLPKLPQEPSTAASKSAPEAPSSPTPEELANKAHKRELKRKEVEEKRAAIERERARLAELERELEED